MFRLIDPIDKVCTLPFHATMPSDRSQRRIDRLMVDIEAAPDQRHQRKVVQLTKCVVVADLGCSIAVRFMLTAGRSVGGARGC